MTNSVTLPLPTSANRIWRRFGKRIVKNPDYVAWQNNAGKLIAVDMKLKALKAVFGRYDLAVALPEKTRCDADNYLKGISDTLQLFGVVQNDKLMRNIQVLRDATVPTGHCRITVSGI